MMVTSAYNSLYQARLSRVRGAVNRLQSLRLLSQQETDELPGIVVVGNQNVGKSSLLEAISGIRLPSSSGFCTKCPLMLEMHKSDVSSITVSYDVNKVPRTRDLVRLEDVTQAISEATGELTGNQNTIVSSIISVKIMTPDSPNLTVIDLPGIVGDAQLGMAKEAPRLIQELVHKYIKGDNRIICFLMLAGSDAAAQATGLSIIKKERRDKDLVRTIGVLTKVDIPGDITVRENIMKTKAAFEIKNGYYAVRCRTRDEAGLTDEQVRHIEAEFFRNSPDFGAEPPCFTGVPVLVQKLEDLQWNFYKRVLPSLRSQISRELTTCTTDRGKLSGMVENEEEARQKVQDLLGSVVQIARSAMGPSFVEVHDQQLVNVETLKHYHRRFAKMTDNFIAQVCSGPSSGHVQPSKDLFSILWSERVTKIFDELIGDLDSAVLKNVQTHPRHVGRVFEEVVHPVLQGPAEGLVDELRESVCSVFQVLLKHVYADWQALPTVIMEQVQILLDEQAQGAKMYIDESIKMLTDYQNLFTKQYIMTCNALIADANHIKAQQAAATAIDSNLVLKAEPWMMVLCPTLPPPGTLTGVLQKLVASQKPSSAADVTISQAAELQIKLIVFSQITLQRFFDQVPIAARAFLVHKVVKLLEGRWLAKRLDDPACVQAMWAAMQAGQEDLISRKKDLDFKITELKACLSALSDPELSFDLPPAAPIPTPASPSEPSRDVYVERGASFAAADLLAPDLS